jgi:hypothetical protein
MTQARKKGLTPADFRRIALQLDGVEEGSHMGSVDFRVGGRIFATLAHQDKGYGNLALTPEEQAAFCEELPDVFVPIAGGWGRMGMTHIVLAKASEDVLRGALQKAWRLRIEATARTKKKRVRKTSAVIIAVILASSSSGFAQTTGLWTLHGHLEFADAEVTGNFSLRY